jgi:hypothetical protein
MANQKHESPDGETRFEVIARDTHVTLPGVRRDYAGGQITREIHQGSGLFARKKFVKAGNASAIVASITFLDKSGQDITGRIGIEEKKEAGYFERFSRFVFFGGPLPSDLGNDARSVKKVTVVYRLPWESSDRTLSSH